MKEILIIALAVVSLVCANQFNSPISDEFIAEINSQQSLWKAGKNFDSNVDIERIRGMLGVIRKPLDNYKIKHYDIAGDIPETFDAREKWPNCTSIKEIADQSSCGSCWAVATASSMSDRVCISSKGEQEPRISANHIMSCCALCGDGCEGGTPIFAWHYWRTDGIVTGGLFNSSVGCQPYPFASCEHHNAAGKLPKCPGTLYTTPSCNSTCANSQTFSLTFGKDSYLIQGETDIQQEILVNGPVVADFDVYDDFLTYKSGVYYYTKGQLLGGHAVRIIGWGVEKNVTYWLVANSWNSDWGEKGLFKIRRGTNECGFESECSGGIPKL